MWKNFIYIIMRMEDKYDYYNCKTVWMYGDEIGQRLADEYGLTFYNKEHIVKLAKEKDI